MFRQQMTQVFAVGAGMPLLNSGFPPSLSAMPKQKRPGG
jgi:hypothetical protein